MRRPKNFGLRAPRSAVKESLPRAVPAAGNDGTVRFDDTLETVLAADISTPFGKASAWRQLVDLIGRGRAPADPRAIARLHALRDAVPVGVRAASARALETARPPAALVALCAADAIAVAAPVLRGARLNSGEWIELLPRLSAAGRAVVRARRDLPAGVEQALAMFAADFAIGDGAQQARSPGTIAELLGRIRERPQSGSAPVDPGEPAAAAVREAATQVSPVPVSPFVSVGAAAKTIPVVAAALRQASDGDGGDAVAAPAEPPEAVAADNPEGRFEIADVVARIDAFYTRNNGRPPVSARPARSDRFRFETDAQGVIRWVEGVARAPLIGLSLDMAAARHGAGVDGIAAGAFRRRGAFSDARLVVAGLSDAAGAWRISATAAFDPATGRFAGYRGTARRPRADEDPAMAPAGGVAADSLRQLMHELRTPTNAIAGFAEMIEREMLGEAPAVYRERAATIRDHARSLLAAIDDLDIAARIEGSALRLQSGQVALSPLLARIADDLGTLAAARGASFALPQGDPAGDAPDAIVAGDARAVERLLSRLLATVMSAAGTGEAIAVAVTAGDDFVAIGVTRPRALAAHPGEALFAIDDEGEDMALLGTGFALRLVRNLARELSGALAIEADRLTVRLPVTVTKSLEVVR